MALWKESDKSASSPLPKPADAPGREPADPVESAGPARTSTPATETRRSGAPPNAESLIAPELIVEGTIEGAGHVRIAGHFKGDVNVRGDLTIEKGAKVQGSVRAERVTIAGDLTGNIESAEHVDLLESGALTGDVKSRTFGVAKGSKMRGQVEFGWDDRKGGVTEIHKVHGDTGGTGPDK